MSEDTNVEQSTDVDQLANGLQNRADADQAELLGLERPLTELTQQVLNHALDAELAQHLGMGSTPGWPRVGQSPRVAAPTRPC